MKINMEYDRLCLMCYNTSQAKKLPLTRMGGFARNTLQIELSDRLLSNVPECKAELILLKFISLRFFQQNLSDYSIFK